MGIDYHSCAICDDAFPDVIDYGYCGNCEEVLCAHCRDEMGEKYGVFDEDHEKTDWFGENTPVHCDECITETYSVEERMDKLLLELSDEEREVLAEKLNGKGNA